MYLNGLCKPLQGVLLLLAKKINSVSYQYSQNPVNQYLKKEVCDAD